MKFLQLGDRVINLASVITYQIRPDREILQDADAGQYEGNPTGRTLVYLWCNGLEVIDSWKNEMTQVIKLTPDQSDAFLLYMQNSPDCANLIPYAPPTA